MNYLTGCLLRLEHINIKDSKFQDLDKFNAIIIIIHMHLKTDKSIV